MTRRTKLAALGLIVVSALAGTGLAWLLRPPDISENKDPQTTGPLAPYFHDWPKPDLVLVLTADQHGYLSPCGCSKPQQGGLERRYNFIQMLKDRGWPVAAVDLGNVPQVEAPAGLPNKQGLIKYRYAMRAMKEMGYIAVGIGDHEAAMPLTSLLDEYAIENPQPRVVSANLMERDKYPDETRAWQLAQAIDGSNIKVGVTAAMGPSVYEQIQKKNLPVKFDHTAPALKAVLKEMDAAKIDLPILLYMGSLVDSGGGDSEATTCARAFPQFPLVVAIDGSDLGRSTPVWTTDPKSGARATMLTTLGHKAKAVGVVGVYRTGKADRPFELRYELVDMGPEFATPPDQEKGQPIHALMEEYAKELKDQNYLAQYPQVKHPSQVSLNPMPAYVGSKHCEECHQKAYDIWKKTGHAHAYQTLVDAKPTSNRQYDPECVVCHTVGFGYLSGYKSEKETAKLENVGCESCHGPGSRHVQDPTDAALQAAMNPWKQQPNETNEHNRQRIDDSCQRCHDSENDVHWTNGGFERNWPKVAHPSN